jgi:hypothetical protein
MNRKKGKEKNRESRILIDSLANRIGVVPVSQPLRCRVLKFTAFLEPKRDKGGPSRSAADGNEKDTRSR